MLPFDVNIDYSTVEVINDELITIEATTFKPDIIIKSDKVIFMIEFENSHINFKRKKRFKVYVSVYDYKENRDNKMIFFSVIFTVENTKLAEYKLNNGDYFSFPIISIADLNMKKIINNIKSKIENNDVFEAEELIQLALTPIMPKKRSGCIEQFYNVAELMSQIDFPDVESKESTVAIVLMLSELYFDKNDSLRKRIHGVYMEKVDCIQEAFQEKYDEGRSEGKLEVARNMLIEGLDLEIISQCTGFSLEEVINLKNQG